MMQGRKSQEAWRFFLLLLEFFLPKSIRQSPIEYQFKARLAVVVLIQAVLLNLGFTLTYVFVLDSFSWDAFLSFVQASIFLGLLFWMRHGREFERMLGFCFLFLIAWGSIYATLINPGVMLQRGLVFPMYILYCSLVCGWVWSLRVGLTAAVGTVFMYVVGSRGGFQLPEGMTLQSYMDSIKGLLITINATMLTFGTLFSLLRRMTRIELRKETDWMLRGSKLREISSYASGLGHQMVVPLDDLRWDLKHLQQRVEGPDFEIQRIAAMEQSVARMVTLSRSLDWVYRNDEGPYTVSASDMLKQLELILGAKAASHAWELRTRCEDENLQIHGAIPAMVLLVVTLAHRICESQVPPTYEAPLRLEVGRKDDQVYWKLTWAEEAQGAAVEREKGELLAMAEEVRGSLIQELLWNCKATLRSFVRNGQKQLEVASRGWAE